MSQPDSIIDPLEPLLQRMRGGDGSTLLRAVEATLHLGRLIARLHATGLLLRDFADGIRRDERGDIRLAPPLETMAFGGDGADLETCPPELQDGPAVNLPAELPAADAELRRHSIACHAARVDVYQLGVVLCRLVMGQSVVAYLQSPRVKSSVPDGVRNVVDAALGYEASRRYETAEELVADLELVGARIAKERDTDGPKSVVQDTDVFPAPSPSAINTGDLSRAGAQPGPPLQRLREYEILERIGQGGMGDVYRGFERSLNRTVAIKVLPADLARQSEFVRRFYAEATAVAGLSHPNVIHIYAVGEDAGHHFFAMQYVDGESLAHLLRRRGRLPWPEALAILEHVLAGLSAAHRRGIVHRDIKPANILIDRVNHRAIVADFGLVKCMDTSGNLTATGIVMGTVDYLSPEQGRGHPVDQRSDLYSVGVLAYQMLSGKLPFRAESATAMVFQHVYEQPPPLAELCAELPLELSAAVHRLMAKSPPDRYASAEETIAALRAAVSGVARQVPVPGNEDASVQPWPATSKSSVLYEPERKQVTGWWTRWRRHGLLLLRQRAPELAAHLQNTQQQVDAAVLDYEGRRNQLQALVAEAEGSLDALRQQADSHRAAAAAHQQRVAGLDDDQEVRLSRDEAAANEAAAASLEFQSREQSQQLDTLRLRLAQVNATLSKLCGQRDILNARLRVAQARGRLELPPQRRSLPRRIAELATLSLGCGLLILAAYFFWPAWLGNGQSAAPASDQAVESQPRSQPGALGQQIFASQKEVTGLALGRSTLLLGHADGTADVLIVNSEGEVNRASQISVALSPVTALALAPDEKLFALGGPNNAISIWTIGGGDKRREIKQLVGHDATVTDLAFSADGMRLLSGSQDGTLLLWDVTRGEIISHSNSGSWIQSIAWSRDESTALIGNRVSGWNSLSLWSLPENRELHLFDTQKKRTEQVEFALSGAEVYSHAGESIQVRDRTSDVTRTFGERIKSAAFSPLTQRVWTADAAGVLGLWDARTGSLIESFAPGQATIRHVAVSDDGTLAVSASHDGEVHVWRLPGLPTPDHQVDSVGLRGPVTFFSISTATAGLITNAGNEVEWWDIANRQQRHNYAVHAHVTAAEFSRDGSQFVYGTDGKNGQAIVGLRDVLNQLLRDTQQFVGHEQAVTGVALMSTNRHVVSGSLDGTVRVWDAKTGTVAKQLKLTTAVTSIALAPDNEQILMGGLDGLVRRWQWQSQDTADEWAGHKQAVTQVRYSLDGRRAVSGSYDQTVRVWDAQAGTLLKTLSGHKGTVNSVALSRNGLAVLSGGDDGTVRLWDATSGEVSRQFDGHVGAVRAVSFSATGYEAISGGDDRMLRVWDLPLMVQ